jgi:hypothetical protein
MSLERTPVYRKLRTRVTFLYLEYEDLLVVLLIAPVSFFVGSLFNRELFGIPIRLVLEWGVPALTILLLVAFKYGKPRGFLRDWWNYHTKPHVYCGLERDAGRPGPYLTDGEGR